jgi:hypothetical protein
MRFMVVGLALLAPGAPSARAADVQVRAVVDRDRLGVGERATLSVEVVGTAQAEVVDLPLAPDGGLTATYLGPSTQVSIVNGRVSQSVLHRYALLATRAGRFTIGPATVMVAGTTYRTAAISVEAVAAAPRAGPGGPAPQARPGEPDLALVLEIPERRTGGEVRAIYVRERIPIVLTLYVGATRVDDVQHPRIEAEGLSIEPFGRPVQQRTMRHGRAYQTVRFETTAVPLTAGEISIAAVQPMSILVRRRGDRAFDRFFGADLFAEREPYELRSNAETLSVRRLPIADRPADFGGAVGRFALEVSAQPREVQATDPVTVTLEVTGTGNLAGAPAPRMADDAAALFKSYPPQGVKDREQLGVRVFEQVLIPTSERVREIPPFRFAYFDPEHAAYRVATSAPIPLTVHPPLRAQAERAGPPAVAAEHDAPVESLGRDIVYIKDRPGRLSRGAPLYRRGWFLGLQVVPLLVYAIGLAVARRRDRLHGDPRYARFAQASRHVRHAIAAARRQAESGRTGEAYDGLARAMREYLSAKLDVPVGAVDGSRIGQRLGDGAAPVVGRISEFFGLVEEARYAPSVDGGAHASSPADGDGLEVVDLAERIVRDIERTRGLEQRFETWRGTGIAAALLVGLVLASRAAALGAGAEDVHGAAAGRDPVTRFFEANALYKAGRYADAAVRYEALREAGFRSGALYFNLGNAYLKAGDLGRAVLGYRRALRVLPRDPDVRANLRFAEEQLSGAAGVAAQPPPLWHRLLFPLAFRATAGELAGAASLVYALILLGLTVRLFARSWRPVLGRLAAVAAFLLAVLSASLGYRIVHDDLRTTAVVVEREGTGVAVRFEPADDGTVHFRVPAGAVVEILAEREGWQQVARADGRRGWIPARALEVL